MQKKLIIKQPKKVSPISLSFKYGAIFLLLALSIVIAACGSNSSSTTIAGAAGTSTSTSTTSKATPTINFSKVNQLSPTPALPAQWCGVWVTNESPSISSGSVPIYAKFVAQKDGNPVGIPGALVTISVNWGDLSGNMQLPTVTTTSDGLAVAYASFVGHSLAINKLTLITAQFSSGSVTCSVGTDRPASFAIVAGTRPTPTKTGK